MQNLFVRDHHIALSDLCCVEFIGRFLVTTYGRSEVIPKGIAALFPLPGLFDRGALVRR